MTTSCAFPPAIAFAVIPSSTSVSTLRVRRCNVNVCLVAENVEMRSFAHRRRTPFACFIFLGLLVGNALMQEVGVFRLRGILLASLPEGVKLGEAYSSFLLGFVAATLQRLHVTLVLEALRRNKALNSCGFCVRLRALLLWLDLSTNNVFADL